MRLFIIKNIAIKFITLTTKEHIQKSLSLAIPVVITQVGQISVNVIDNIFVGRLGEEELASVSLGNAIFITAFVFCIGFSFAISPLVAHAHAQKDTAKISSIFKHALFLNLLLTLLVALLVYFSIPVMDYLHQPKEVLPDAKLFLIINLFSLFPFMIFQTYRQVAEGLSMVYYVSFATIIANIINIILNYGLVYGNFGLPRLEVAGSATATLIARTIMCILLMIFLMNNQKTKHYFQKVTFKIHTFSQSMFQRLMHLGFPSAFQMFFEVSAFAIAAFICGYNEQTNQLAAHQITINLASITFMMCTGLSVSATIRVGNQLGLKDYISLQKAAYTNIALVIAFMALCGIGFVIFRNHLPWIYLDNRKITEDTIEVIQISSQLMIVAAFFQLSDGIQVVSLGALRGLQDVKIPTIITFIAYYVFTLPLGWILAITFDMKALGMWIALGVGLSVSALLLFLRLKQKTKKLIISNIGL